MYEEQSAGRGSSDDPPPSRDSKVLKIKPSVGVLTVGPAVFPQKGDGDGSRRRGGNSNFSQNDKETFLGAVKVPAIDINNFMDNEVEEEVIDLFTSGASCIAISHRGVLSNRSLDPVSPGHSAPRLESGTGGSTGDSCHEQHSRP